MIKKKMKKSSKRKASKKVTEGIMIKILKSTELWATGWGKCGEEEVRKREGREGAEGEEESLWKNVSVSAFTFSAVSQNP